MVSYNFVSNERVGNMFRKLSKSHSGFTIIEVMIVLALAGLIIAAVIVAVPQLQRNQRNSARRSLLGRISTEINNYQGNHSGDIPTTATFASEFLPKYINTAPTGTFQDPSGTGLNFITTAVPGGGTIAVGTVVYRPQTLCNGELPNTGGSGRQFAIAIGLEGGSSYCLDNK